ncbi:MAG: 50S ribosomal protein L13 [Verrucomicrobia bacterium]|nr:50S ribosomal protein L13 [Verrucomicrobiota bacterium]
MKTYMAKPADVVDKKWFVVDAAGKTLGRLATVLADTLRGKRKPTFTPHVDTGDFVIVINAEKVQVTGRKAELKEYDTYSGWPSGRKVRTYNQVMAKHPTRIIEHAVRGMLPRNTLGRTMFRKLKVYAGPEHPHEAQKPEPLEV